MATRSTNPLLPGGISCHLSNHRAAGRSSLLAPLALGACNDEPLPTEALTEVPRPEFGKAVTVPMKISGQVEFVGEAVPPPAPCLQFFNTVINGRTTHLGRFEGVGSTCILEIVALPDPDPPFLPAGPPPYLTARFSNPLWVLTAANGDQLRLEALDAVAVISLADNSLRAEGTHRILGGTGRFAEATGELETVAMNEDGQGPDDFRSRGWIRFQASNRSSH